MTNWMAPAQCRLATVLARAPPEARSRKLRSLVAIGRKLLSTLYTILEADGPVGSEHRDRECGSSEPPV